MSCSEITTREIFEANFQSISVPGDNLCELNPKIWNFEGSENVIFQWLQATSVSIVSTSRLIDKKNEHSLYPLVFDLLKPIVALANDLVLRSSQPSRDNDDIVAACEVVADAFSRESSSRSSSLSEQPTGAAAAAGMEDEFFSPALVDGTDAQQLAELYIAIEKQLQSNKVANKGRVELAVVQTVSNLIQLLVEVKFSTVTDVDKGLWQTCSELIIASGSSSRLVAGVYTDYTYWTFLVYDPSTSRISKSRKYTLALASGCFTLEAYEILRFLFEFLGVSPEIALTESLGRVQALNDSLAHIMMADLEKDRSQRQALKRAEIAEQRLAELQARLTK